MRENGLYGSEGGEPQFNAAFLPVSHTPFVRQSVPPVRQSMPPNLSVDFKLPLAVVRWSASLA